ncbi:hypothetical protein CEUSTIGMA_g12300.t1 [Chlamydomonas eustigma]|uniref:Uncharacterized protein n=1 Tax=Chlamydomonas eustigma TaxID=1157962 RepID=A0A250XPK4_9CHLO|nr:hypothetical protein CEUSTIGMA_g12300.t1 [Chlamydomonas eustigma]|eukprot:GAX84879.1 hypothetical protein CEUSTIGMA_g12300.t1 [Chlamydomonas eustigma]
MLCRHSLTWHACLQRNKVSRECERMNVNLRLIQDRMTQHKVDAPCTGLAAKALGKYKLEEETGLFVKFFSYQESSKHPEVQLADDDLIQRGAILNFSVKLDSLLQDHKHHRNLIQGLYDSKLRSLISKYSARLIKPAITPSDIQNKGTLQSLYRNKQQALDVEAALVAAGSLMTAEVFGADLDSAYADRNREQHVNTNAQLQVEFERMRKAGVVALMQEEMPLECLILDHFEVFLQLLSP